MAKVFDKLFGKKQTVEQNQKTTDGALPRPRYDFVEQYTIVDPKNVMNGGYELFSLCKNIPVVCEESPKTCCGFSSCIEMPTNIVLGFLETLKNMPTEKIADPKMRTLSIVHLSPEHRIVIGPSFDDSKKAILWSADSKKKGDWVFDITPDKNRAIVEQLKIHTR